MCSLTSQPKADAAALAGASLFGDGAAAPGVPGPVVVATRSRLYPRSEQLMLWDIGADGFHLVLSRESPDLTERYLGEDVRAFLADHGHEIRGVATWVCHPGGPKIVDAVISSLRLPPDSLSRTRASLSRNGNMSSVSVLDVLSDTLAGPRPAPGSPGLLMTDGASAHLTGWLTTRPSSPEDLRALLVDSGCLLIRPIGGRWNPRRDFEETVLAHHPSIAPERFAAVGPTADQRGPVYSSKVTTTFSAAPGVSVSSYARSASSKGTRWLISFSNRSWCSASSGVTSKISVG